MPDPQHEVRILDARVDNPIIAGPQPVETRELPGKRRPLVAFSTFRKIRSAIAESMALRSFATVSGSRTDTETGM